jgi:ATP-dependent Clp endopeptidase proteolytic subunit ClpP
MFHDDRDDYADIQLSYTSQHDRNHKRRRCTTDEEEDTEADGGKCRASTDDKKKNTGHPCLSDADVASRCFARNNHIYFFSGVSKDSVYRLKECICKLNEKYEETKQKHPTLDIQPKPIYLHINSYGGGVFAAFAAIDFIQQSKIPIHTIIEGASASAATLMSVVGAKRYIRPHASMLIHQLSSWFGGKLTEIEDDYKNVTQMHNTIKDIYKKHTTIRDAELEEMLKHDLWWTADKCLEEGLVDEIWEGE